MNHLANKYPTNYCIKFVEPRSLFPPFGGVVFGCPSQLCPLAHFDGLAFSDLCSFGGGGFPLAMD